MTTPTSSVLTIRRSKKPPSGAPAHTPASPEAIKRLKPKGNDSFDAVLREARMRLGTGHEEFRALEIDPIEVGVKYIVDPAWQRVRREGHVQRIARGLSYHGFTSPLVLAEKGGKFYVLDGCHRLEAVRLNGKKCRLYALIYKGLTDDEMRELFLMLNSISKVVLTDLLSSYRGASPAFQKYGHGEDEELFPLALGFVSARGKKTLTSVNYMNVLSAYANWARQSVRHSRERNSLLRLWKSQESLVAMEKAEIIVTALLSAGVNHPYFFGALVLQVFMELLEQVGEQGFALLCTRLERVNMRILKRQTASVLPDIRGAILRAITSQEGNAGRRPKWVEDTRFPDWVVAKCGLIPD